MIDPRFLLEEIKQIETKVIEYLRSLSDYEFVREVEKWSPPELYLNNVLNAPDLCERYEKLKNSGSDKYEVGI